MEIIDITVPLAVDLPVFPGDPPVRVEPLTMLKRGDAANVATLAICTHSGTHLDAPRHYDDSGTSIDQISLSLLMGEAVVADFRGVSDIDRNLLARLPLKGVERLLLKTDNSELWGKEGFYDEYAALTEDGAEYLVLQGVRLVGIDYLSIEHFSGDGAVHRRLLDAGVLILEGLDLSIPTAGIYELVCLPLKVYGGDGAPARAILRRRRHGHKDLDTHSTRWPLA